METTQQVKRKVFGLNPVIFISGLVSLFTDLSSEMIVPILPLFLTPVLNVPVSAVGVIEGIAESTASVLKLFSGWLSDRIGRRKPLMVAGYGFSNLVKPLFALSTSWGQVLAIRFADRFGKGVRGAPRDALLADASTKEERGKAFGFHRSLDTIGAALGPFTAFVVLSFFHRGYRTVFGISAVPGIIAVILLVFFLKEVGEKSRNPSQAKMPKFGLRELGTRYVLFTLVAMLFAIGNSSDAFLVLRAQNVGMAAGLIPLAYFAFNVTYSIFAIPFGVLSDRIWRRTVLVLGYLIFAGIYVGFGLANRSVWIWVLFLIYGLYYAATEGVQKAHVGDLVQRGMAMGTFNALTGLAALPASILAGLLWQAVGPGATFELGAVCAGLAALLLLSCASELDDDETSRMAQRSSCSRSYIWTYCPK